MSRLEVKNPPQTALERTAAAKDFTACKPACKYHIIRLWDIKIFPVHLLDGNVQLRRKPLRNRMRRRSHKKALAVSMLPAQCHACPHQQTHYLREMCGVECDQAHSLKDMLLYALRHLVRKRFVCHVPPVDQNICLREHVLRQSVLWLRQCRSAKPQIFIL